jgi:hypothetical protein
MVKQFVRITPIEVLHNLVSQEATKLQAVKVGGQKITLIFWVRGYVFLDFI